MIGTTEIIIIATVLVFFFGIEPLKKWVKSFNEVKKEINKTKDEDIK